MKEPVYPFCVRLCFFYTFLIFVTVEGKVSKLAGNPGVFAPKDHLAGDQDHKKRDDVGHKGNGTCGQDANQGRGYQQGSEASVLDSLNNIPEGYFIAVGFILNGF